MRASPAGGASGSRIRRATEGLQPPQTVQEEYSFRLHGIEHRDEFVYLRNPEDPRTHRYIEQENVYFRDSFAPVAGFLEQMYDELKARIIEDDASVPETINGYRYYTRVEAGRQYPIHCRRPERGGDEEVYLDENHLCGSSRYCAVSVVSLCPRQERVACSVDRTGSERYDILIADMPGGELRLVAPETGGSIAWTRDGCHLLYTGIDDKARPDSVWAHDLDGQGCRRLYREEDPAFHVTVWLSRSGEWLFIDSASNTSSETLVMRADGPLPEPAVLSPRREDVEYMVDHHEDRFLVLTNDTAENFRLVAMPVDGNGGVVGEELIAADDAVTLEYVDAYKGHWIIGERRQGAKYVTVWDPAAGTGRRLPGGGALSYLDVEDLYDYEARFARYEYSTAVTPHTVYDYDTASGESVQRRTTNPPGYDQSAYTTERFDVPVGNVRVPLSLVYRKNAPRWPEAPLLLTGYGAYEESMVMEFDSDLVSLLDRGVVAATAHVRGGGDLGPAWHDAGRLGGKERSFTDFLACARFLVQHGYTGPGRIAAWGASAGGLLVAEAARREPALFASVVLEVPFVDVINTLLDRGLPLTEYDFDEFGNPAVAEEYHWIRAYSPYDNVQAHPYPPMLVTTAMQDQRVGFWEALKWTARLRAARSDDNPLLLKVDDGGHLGQSGRYEAVRETAVVYTFLLDMWGLLPEQ